MYFYENQRNYDDGVVNIWCLFLFALFLACLDCDMTTQFEMRSNQIC